MKTGVPVPLDLIAGLNRDYLGGKEVASRADVNDQRFRSRGESGEKGKESDEDKDANGRLHKFWRKHDRPSRTLPPSRKGNAVVTIHA